MFGELRLVDDVPAAFAEVVVGSRPGSIALSGGETARRCYEQLAAQALPWRDIEVFFGDERFVPVDDPASNEGMARRALLDRVAPSPRAVHSLFQAGATIEAAAQRYDELVRGHRPIGLVHLGVGPDGHTASLFPGTAALEERERYVVPNGDKKHPAPRLTFTYPAIARSRLVVFTVAGEDKREALARIRAGDDLPAARVRAERVLWLVDHAANGPDRRQA
jgi:6-phosphogluconolactonase